MSFFPLPGYYMTVERGYKVSIWHLAHSKYTSNIYYHTYKTVLLYGGSDKVKITPRLLTAKVKASQTDQKRIQSEYEENKRRTSPEPAADIDIHANLPNPQLFQAWPL